VPEVIKIIELAPAESVYRELAIVKVLAQDPSKRSDLLNYISIFRAKVIDASKDTLVIEIVGNPTKINAFLDLMRGFGIAEMAKTGIVALSRGSKPQAERTAERP